MICYLKQPNLWSLLRTGRALPPPGTTDSGSDDPPSESSDTAAADPKTFLVMSGGEGYIDFRLGECVTARRRPRLRGDAPLSPPGSRLTPPLPPQGTKAASWTGYQSQRRAHSQRQPRTSGATSSSGRSQRPMTEIYNNQAVGVRAAHRPPHGPTLSYPCVLAVHATPVV